MRQQHSEAKAGKSVGKRAPSLKPYTKPQASAAVHRLALSKLRTQASSLGRFYVHALHIPLRCNSSTLRLNLTRLRKVWCPIMQSKVWLDWDRHGGTTLHATLSVAAERLRLRLLFLTLPPSLRRSMCSSSTGVENGDSWWFQRHWKFLTRIRWRRGRGNPLEPLPNGRWGTNLPMNSVHCKFPVLRNMPRGTHGRTAGKRGALKTGATASSLSSSQSRTPSLKPWQVLLTCTSDPSTM